jgi:hypothetical protein
VLIDHTFPSSFQRGGDRSCGVRDIDIEERRKGLRRVREEERPKQEQQSNLRLRKLRYQREKEAKVALLTTLDDGRRMDPSRGQIDAGLGARNLDQPFRRAAHRTDALAECRAITLGLPDAAKRASRMSSHDRRAPNVVRETSNGDKTVTKLEPCNSVTQSRPQGCCKNAALTPALRGT